MYELVSAYVVGSRSSLTLDLNYIASCFLIVSKILVIYMRYHLIVCSEILICFHVLSGTSLVMYICIHVCEKGIYSRGT